MSPVLPAGDLALNELSAAMKEQREMVRSKYLGLKEEFQKILDRLKNQRSFDEPYLFNLLTDVLTDMESRPELWIEKVFQYDVAAYQGDFIAEHSLNVGILSMALGFELDVRGRDNLILGAGALLHDIGMCELPADLIDMPRPLTERERRIVESHPTEGRRLLEGSQLSDAFARLVYQEQERQDGTGYPQQLKGDEIDTYARIIGFCDTIESITHFRPYRKPKSFYEGFQILVSEGKEKFPKDVWIAALRRITPYPPGTLVRLSNEKLARVLKTSSANPLKPVVELVGEPVARLSAVKVLDLKRSPMLYIKEQVQDSPAVSDDGKHVAAPGPEKEK
ncbi:MAG: HD domain-containing protein [Nitrospirae bacterium]|nr:HD domain-containing protein [Nitrospirota bacterium]